MDALRETGFDVQIETNGSLWVELPEDERITIVCSPKTPKLDPLLVSRVNAYKYVIAHNQISEADGLPCESTQTAGREATIARPIGRADVYVMPMDEGDPVTNQLNTRAAVESALKFGYRLTLQTHKMVGVQ